MRKLSILILLVAWLGPFKAQLPLNEPFGSVFGNMKSGRFGGTVSGVLFVKQGASEMVLDFQGNAAELVLKPDHEEMYDVSEKVYTGRTTSGKTEVLYSTYNMANSLQIVLNGVSYRINFIDGASDEVIEGLTYFYKSEKATEYLVLQAEKEITLSNFYSLATASSKNKPDLETIKKQEQKLVLLPHSTLIFAIRR